MNDGQHRTVKSGTGKGSSSRVLTLAPPVLFAVLVVVPLLAFSIHPAAAHPVEIATDTLWEGSVDVHDEVRVLKGAVLLIQPGATVRFAGEAGGSGQTAARIVVNGTLVAQGTADAPVVFTSAGKNPRPGDWAGIVLEHANENTNRISHARIEYAEVGITGSYSKLRVEHATIRNNHTGVSALQELNGSIFDSTVSGNTLGIHFYQGSSFQVESCAVSGNLSGGIGCTMGSSPAVRRSTITDNGEHAIACIQGSSPVLEGNVIRGHQRGIYVELQSKPLISRNAITNNETGIWAEKHAFARIYGNTIRQNGVGIYCNFASYPEIRGNNLEDNEKFAIVVGDNMSIKVEKLIPFRSGGGARDAAPVVPEVLPPQTRKFAPFPAGEEGLVDARGNWWGAKVLAEMEKLGEGANISVIEDFHDKPDTFYRDTAYPRDRVQYSPWERGSAPDTDPPPASFARIGGKVESAGNPVPGVRVHAYSNADESFKGPGFTYSAPTAADGSYALNLPGGTYFLVVKGPLPPFPNSEPGAGAYFGVYADNPLQIANGASASVTLRADRKAR